MFKQIAMLASGLMDRLFMGRSMSMEQQLLLNARPLRANTTQGSQQPAPSPAKPKAKRKSLAAKAGTTVASRKPKQKPAQPAAVSGVNGLQQVIPASQPASQSRKRKPKAVPPTTQASSRKRTPKPAQTTSGKGGSQPATPARKTRQHAK
jgi:hypothetical protein